MKDMIRGAPTDLVAPAVEYGQLGWVNYEGEGLPTHIVPTWDIRGHVLDTKGELCACRPSYDEGVELIVHNAFDERERYEDKARKH